MILSVQVDKKDVIIDRYSFVQRWKIFCELSLYGNRG
jgi:hypothetical protein